MASQWSSALLGALGGAAIAVSVVYGAAVTGHFPQNDEHIKTYLISHPELFAEMGSRYQELQDDQDDMARQQAVSKLGTKSFFDPGVAYVTGPAGARTTFVEFFDYNCQHCRNSVEAVQRFYNAHRSDTRFAFIDFPIFGAQSTFAARAAVAARRQPDKYVPFYFAMMEQDGAVNQDSVIEDAKKVGLDVDKLKTDMNDPSVATIIDRSLKLAHAAHIDGTPEFIVDGHSHEGEVDDALLNQMSKGGVSRS